MSIFGKVMFWKKGGNEAALDEPAGFADETGLTPPSFPPSPGPVQMGRPMPAQPTGYMPEPQYSQPSFQQPAAFQNQQAYIASRDTELILAKLDSLRAALENLSQRVANIERLAREAEDYEARRRSW